MKRLLVVHTVYGMRGGAERAVLETSSFLKQHYEVNILAPTSTNCNLEEWDSCFEKHYTSSTKLGPFDLILIHKCNDESILRMLVEKGIPIAQMVHDHEAYCPRGSKYFPISQTVCRRKAGVTCLFPCARLPNWKWLDLNRQFSAYFVGSTYMRDELVIQGYPLERIFIICPNIGELSHLVSTPEAGKIAFAGQLIKGKGLAYLVRALSEVTRPWQLHVFGSGPEETPCRRLAKAQGIDRYIHFHGFVSQQKLVNAYQSVQLGCVPSVWPEPFGIVGLEFMRQEIPVVAFNSGGISDWLEHGQNGVLVSRGSVRELAEAIDLLLRDREKAFEMGRIGKKKFTNDFNREKTFLRMLSILKKI